MRRMMIAVICGAVVMLVVSTAMGVVPFNAPGFTYTKVVDAGSTVCRAPAFSPDGKLIAFTQNSTTMRLYDRTTGTTTTLATTDTMFTSPYFSADGTKIGWTKANSETANDLVVYTISTGASTVYAGPTGTADASNSDFFGSATDQWTAWAYGPTGGGDLFLYSVNGTEWAQGANLTSSATLKEYEPDSNAAGDKILYWSGETAGEPIDTTHTLTNVGGVWTKDIGFTPITYSTWAFWSADEAQIGVTKFDTGSGYGKGDLYVYDSSGNFLFDLTGPGVGQGSYWQFFGFNFNVGNEYVFASAADNTLGGRDIWIANQAVSEPSELALVALGLLGISRRRK